jgi:DNA-binding GntR family transcriptional regulator
MIPRLEAEGLIRAIPQRGLQVAQPDVHLVREAFELREMIEVTALARFVAAASDAAVQEQRKLLDSVSRESEHGITASLLAQAQAIDWGFHDALVDSLGNRLVSDIHRVNAIRIRMMMPDRVTLSVTTLPPAIAEHEAILAGIENRDADAARTALRSHLASARRRALAIETAEDAPLRGGRGGVGNEH